MTGPFTTDAEAQLTLNCIAKIDNTTYQVNSKSNPNGKSYIIDINDLRAHKGECLGFRYNPDCNHMKRLRKAGVNIPDPDD